MTSPDPREREEPRAVSGVELIANERQRQIEVEGWDAAHDAGQADELARASAAYALPEAVRLNEISPRSWRGTVPPPAGPTWLERLWPWDEQWWKPTPDDRIRELVKAGALIAAAIDSLEAEKTS